MKRTIAFAGCALLAACATTPPEPAPAASDADRAAILAIIDDMFDALETREPDRWRPYFIDGTVRVVAFAGPDGADMVQIRTPEEHMAGLAGDGPRLLERYWGPVVLSDGRIAMAWTPYDFYVDGDFSHCGTNLFEFVRADGQWKVANLSWSMKREDCPDSPLGPAPPPPG
ncbi:MAG: hypothetical protein AAFX03_12645 [Pseudomonadota bacterium]